MSTWKSVRGVTKPESIDDSAIEQIYDALSRRQGFWQDVKNATNVSWSLGRTLRTHSTFTANAEDLPTEIDRDNPDECVQALVDIARRRRGTIAAGLMTVLGDGVTFHFRERDGSEGAGPAGLIDPGFVSIINDFSFPLSSARLLHQNIGIRGQELHSITQIQNFFNPPPYVTSGETPNHVDNFMRAYQGRVPLDDQMNADFITRAFSRIAVVADALRGNEVHDQATARRNFAIAEETVQRAADQLASHMPPELWDPDSRSALIKTTELLGSAKSFREARGRGLA